MSRRPGTVLCSSAGWTRAERATWARLCRRFPDIGEQIEHSAYLAAAQLIGATNARMRVGRTFGGWKVWVHIYSPQLVGDYQCIDIHDPTLHTYPGEVPPRFDSLEDAVIMGRREEGAALRALKKRLEKERS